MSDFKYDIVVIGTGRVGLPLGLMLAKVGFKCFGIDKNKDIINKVNHKEMPFHEPGFEGLIKIVDFTIYDDFAKIAQTKNIIITVGTPLLHHIETDLSQINLVIDQVIPYLAKGHTIILRSTVAPKTTHYIKNYLEKKTEFRIGDDIFLAFCPERIVEGKAYQELTELPQIIGAEDDESFLNAKSIFSCLTQHIMRTSYTSAELAKLFNNIYRYVECAISNQFALIADSYDQDVYSILHMSNFKYPRATILSPGLTAGTCLRKDFGMINEAIPYSDLLLSSWKVNEYIPKFLIDHLLKRTEVKDKNIAVLGYTFKKDSDDIRDSLVPKLLRYIEREVPNIIKIHEPHLENIDEKYENYTLDKAIDNADIVYISVNHSEFKLQKEFILDKVKTTCWFVDIWNVLDTNKIFFKKGEVLK